MRDANPVRLLILGLLASGPMHGHQIRRTAEQTDIEQWGGVKVGALYGMLHRLEAEGLVEPLRAEQEGRRPQRTVYAITEDGWKELAIHRDRALTQPDLHSTTVEIALNWAAGLDYDALRERLSLRRSAVARALKDLAASRELHLQEGHLPVSSIAGYRRTELHLEAELVWHDELEAMLPAIAADSAGAGAGPGPEAPTPASLGPASPGPTSPEPASLTEGPTADVTPLRERRSRTSDAS